MENRLYIGDLAGNVAANGLNGTNLPGLVIRLKAAVAGRAGSGGAA